MGCPTLDQTPGEQMFQGLELLGEQLVHPRTWQPWLLDLLPQSVVCPCPMIRGFLCFSSEYPPGHLSYEGERAHINPGSNKESRAFESNHQHTCDHSGI